MSYWLHNPVLFWGLWARALACWDAIRLFFFPTPNQVVYTSASPNCDHQTCYQDNKDHTPKGTWLWTHKMWRYDWLFAQTHSKAIGNIQRYRLYFNVKVFVQLQSFHLVSCQRRCLMSHASGAQIGDEGFNTSLQVFGTVSSWRGCNHLTFSDVRHFLPYSRSASVPPSSLSSSSWSSLSVFTAEQSLFPGAAETWIHWSISDEWSGHRIIMMK